MTPAARRGMHALVGVVATVAVVWQLALVVRGGRVLDETELPSLATRLVRFASYFTVLSNVLVAGTAWLLASEPARDGRWWRVVRMATVVGITITGLVHWFLLRPLLDLHGADAVVDKLLHVVVPLLAVLGWAVADPHARWHRRDAALSLLWPVAWTCYTLVHGLVTGWYPYPFLDLGELGAGKVMVTMTGIAALFGLVAVGFVWVDGRLRDRAAVADG